MLDSAFLFYLSLLVRVLTLLLPVAVLLRFLFSFLRLGLAGPPVPQYNFDMLVAGACARNPPADGGALAFLVYDTPSWAYWSAGSAMIYR